MPGKRRLFDEGEYEEYFDPDADFDERYPDIGDDDDLSEGREEGGVIEFDNNFTRETKWFDFVVGGFTTSFIIPTSSSITRWEFDCSRVIKGTDSVNRTGNNIQVQRFSVRVAFWLQNASASARGITGDSFTGVELRAFCFVDKEKVYNATAPTSLSGNAALGSFNNALGFLAANRMNSFYNMDCISKYRILKDTGLQHIIPKKSRIDYPLGTWNGVGVTPGTPFIFESMFQNQTILSNTRTDNALDTDEVIGAIDLDGTIDGAVELVAGTGGPIELGLFSLLSDVTFSEVNTRTNPTIVENPITTFQTDNNVNARLSYWKPMPTPHYFDFDFTFNDLDVYYPENVEPVYPIKNALRFGFIMYNTSFDVRIAIDSRIVFSDD